MPLSFILLVVVLVVLFGIAYYFQELYPYTLKAIFNGFKDRYKEVQSGQMSFFAFKEEIINEYSHVSPKDSPDMVRFKKEIISMLDYEDFIKQTLSDPEITMDGLRVAWRKFDPSISSESVVVAGSPDVEEQAIPEAEEKVIPKVFTKGPGKKVMDMMVEHGYCAPSTLEWVYDGENSSYLQVLFADAIGKHLDFGRKRWSAFTSIWGEKNYSDLLSKAIECDNVKNLGLKVKALFPEYEVPESYAMR